VFRRLLITFAAVAATLLFVQSALAVRVHVRVEGKVRTIFGATAPLIDVTSPRANALPENALDALETAIRRVPARSLRRLFEPAIAELRRGL